MDESGEVDESGTAEGPGAIIESEKSEKIRENCSGQEEHSDSSEYGDSIFLFIIYLLLTKIYAL